MVHEFISTNFNSSFEEIDANENVQTEISKVFPEIQITLVCRLLKLPIFKQDGWIDRKSEETFFYGLVGQFEIHGAWRVAEIFQGQCWICLTIFELIEELPDIYLFSYFDNNKKLACNLEFVPRLYHQNKKVMDKNVDDISSVE